MSGTSHYLSEQGFSKLNAACLPLNAAFGSGCVFLVGSVLTTQHYRDVDVRLVLTDPDYDRLGTGMRALLTSSVSALFDKTTGLLVDFQIAKASVNDREYGRSPRMCLGRSLSPGVIGISSVTRLVNHG